MKTIRIHHGRFLYEIRITLTPIPRITHITRLAEECTESLTCQWQDLEEDLKEKVLSALDEETEE